MVDKAEGYRCRKDASSMDAEEMFRYREEVRRLKGYVLVLELSVPELEKYEEQSRPQLDKKIDSLQRDLKKSNGLVWFFGIATIVSAVLAIIAFIS